MFETAAHGPITVLTMRHGKANALDIEFCEALAARFAELRQSDTGAVVLTGQGRMFSAGVDLKRLSEGGADYIRAFLPALHRLYDAVFFHPRPVVAAINGHAIAGGAILATCADRRIMVEHGGRIGVTELQVGLPFPALAFEILRFAVPPRYLPEFTLSGATYDTDEAMERGWKSSPRYRRPPLPRPRNNCVRPCVSAWRRAALRPTRPSLISGVRRKHLAASAPMWRVCWRGGEMAQGRVGKGALAPCPRGDCR
jgi:hypothetical protein